MKVLLAEDDVISAQVLQTSLKKWGHEVLLAENGAEAWEKFGREHPDLVITDWMMPEMDGLELVRRIRLCARPGYVYVILLTALSKKEDIVRGMEAGADDFLTKPFDRDELRVRLRAGERIVRLEQSLARRNDELETANAQISAANRRMKRDLEAAAKIQQALLPAAAPRGAGVNFAWTFKPCEELAGDILGVVALDEGHAGLYVLDVSGHGVAAALLSVAVRHILTPAPGASSILRQSSPDGERLATPPEVAAELNRRFPMDPHTGQYFTLLYGVLDYKTYTFRYISAGHPGPIHLPREGNPVLLTTPGLPIGIDEDMTYLEKTLPLRPGDRLYLFSDGITEAFNPSGEQFGGPRLLEALARGRAAPLKGSLDGLLTDVVHWAGGQQLKDDVSLLAAEIPPGE